MSTAISLGPVSSDSLIVVLTRDKAGAFLAKSVQMVSGDMRTSHCFTVARPVHSTFVPEFARTVLSAVEPLAGGADVLDTPGFSFSLPGICISGLRIDAPGQDLPSGSFRLHFRRYVGDITRILEFEQSVELPPATVRERIAVDVLRDIVSPIFDMLALSASGSNDAVEHHSAALQARLDRMKAQQQEIEFYTGMLKRYVSGCQHDVAEMKRTEDEPASTIALRRALQ